MIKVHLFRPFSAEHLLAAMPKTVERVCVLDRTKEPGAPGEPLYLDVVNALLKCRNISISSRWKIRTWFKRYNSN